MSSMPRRTPLFDAHTRAGARLVDFAGFELPIQYESPIAEHMAVRTNAGLFDVSHMGQCLISGPAALACAQHLLSNDLSRIADGQAAYSGLLNEQGGFVDDVVVYRFSAEKFLLVLNAANVAKDLAWIRDHAQGAQIDDLSDDFAQLAIQGPASRRILARLTEANLDALAYYYHGADGNDYERLQSGFIVGHSLLTARGIPCAGEGDLKTALAMKICDLLGAGGSFCEIVTTDYLRGTILMGHDGPFHLAIAKGRPILRGLGLYHGKRGSGVSVEAKVKSGPVTTLGVTQTGDGKMKFIVSEAEATDDPIMAIGNTQTHVRLATDPDTWYERWLMEAPTHHFAMSVGHNAAIFRKVAGLLGIPFALV